MGTVTGIELPSFGNCPRNSGEVIGKFHRRHRAKEFLAFLNEIDRQVPEDLDVYLIMDNYGARKTEKSVPGSPPARDTRCTSRRLQRHGSIWSNTSSP